MVVHPVAVAILFVSLLIQPSSAKVVSDKGIPAREIPGVTGIIPPFAKDGRFVNETSLSQKCSFEEGITLGIFLIWGLNFYTSSKEECCNACQRKQGCNAWKYCAAKDGCGAIFETNECWLKHRHLEDKNASYVYVDPRTKGYITGFVETNEVHDALDLYYAVGEYQRSLHLGKVIRNERGNTASGEFRFVSVADCAHLCEMYQSRGCTAFHYNKATFNDIESCTLVSGASTQTVDGEKTELTTFFRDASLHREKGIVALDDFRTHTGDDRYYQATASLQTIPVLSENGLRMNYTSVTLEECADLCVITVGCDSFDYKSIGGSMCVLRKKADMEVEDNTEGWQTYWSADITASSYEVAESINKPKDGISKALWVAIGVLLLFGVIALVAVPCFLYRRKAKIIILNPKRSSKLLGINSPPLTEVDLNLDYGKMDLDRENPLGSGSFGVVYSGVYACMPVAVKVLSPAFQVGPYLRSFQEEIKILSRVRHENIVLCYGGCVKPPKICIVEELMAASLGEHLVAAGRKRTLSVKETLELTRDIAAGLDHLHPMIVHRDLKPQNILLDKEGRAKIAAFGLSRMKAATYLSTNSTGGGTMCYMAPECFQEQNYNITEKVDIYALACLIWECLSGEAPWEELTNPCLIMSRVGIMGDRPVMPDGVPVPVSQLIKDCWCQNYRERPTAQEVLVRCKTLLERCEIKDCKLG